MPSVRSHRRKGVLKHRLSRMQKISENEFAILVNFHFIFKSFFFLEPENVNVITLVAKLVVTIGG